MTQPQKPLPNQAEQVSPAKSNATPGKATDHLANERTFLAWIRTGLAIITFGFVVERFGVVIAELDPARQALFVLTFRASALIGVALVILGVLVLGFALISFLQTRRSIEIGNYHSAVWFAVLMTGIAGLIGIILAFYLLLSL